MQVIPRAQSYVPKSGLVKFNHGREEKGRWDKKVSFGQGRGGKKEKEEKEGKFGGSVSDKATFSSFLPSKS